MDNLEVMDKFLGYNLPKTQPGRNRKYEHPRSCPPHRTQISCYLGQCNHPSNINTQFNSWCKSQAHLGLKFCVPRALGGALDIWVCKRRVTCTRLILAMVRDDAPSTVCSQNSMSRALMLLLVREMVYWLSSWYISGAFVKQTKWSYSQKLKEIK